jgi:uncharacterized protein
MKTVILGASNKPDRYSYKAMVMLEQHHHEVVLVHPSLKVIEGRNVLSKLSLVQGPIGTLTMYVSPAISDTMESEIVALHPERVIFNPGSENPRVARNLRALGITVEEACTLVLLQTNQY